MQYFETMLRKEPGTFVVMILMIALLAYGVWYSWPVPKAKSAASSLDHHLVGANLIGTIRDFAAGQRTVTLSSQS